MFWKTYVVVLISRSSFQKSSDIFVMNTNGVSIYISGVSLIISVDSILILLFPIEFPSAEKIKGSSTKFKTSVDRCWDVNVDRWSSRVSKPLFEVFIYATSCVIELLCNLLLVFCNSALLHEEVVSPIGCLKDVCNILSRYVQCTLIYCFYVAIWVPENTNSSGVRYWLSDLSFSLTVVFGFGRLSIDVVWLMSIDVEGLMSIDGGMALSIGWLKCVLSQAAYARL
ncbi:hypothetical protein F2Q69_00007085 [Brassica cretica]|uniref:Transmembrane protein n=1 Tax=Brassica cretica TaxID=69181 RepID=A0A8S9NL91_BRACR|nr:hypothetical protein F2Q69_00007085 [Brassica cretica]